MSGREPDGMSAEGLGRLLTARQRAFCEGLLAGLPQEEAAVQAGYSRKTAATQASMMLKKEKISDYLRARTAARYKSMGITPEWVGIRLAEIVERCMAGEPHMTWDSERKEYIADGTWKFDAKGATTALRAIGESMGMFKPQAQEKSGNGLQVSFHFPGGEGGEFAK